MQTMRYSFLFSNKEIYMELPVSKQNKRVVKPKSTPIRNIEYEMESASDHQRIQGSPPAHPCPTTNKILSMTMGVVSLTFFFLQHEEVALTKDNMMSERATGLARLL